MKQVEQHQKFVRFFAIFFVFTLLAVFCLPTSVLASITPPITVTIDSSTFSGGADVVLTVKIKNTGGNPITIKSVTLEENTSFTKDSVLTGFTSSLGAGAETSVNVSTRYSGRGQGAKIAVEVDGYNVYRNTIDVAEATPNKSEGTGGNKDLPEDAKPFVYEAKTTTFRAGDASAFPLTLATSSGYDAENVRITLSCADEKGKDGFAFQENNGSYIVDWLSDQQEITPTLVVSPSIPDGSYTVTLNFRYEDYLGNSYQNTDTVRITVRGRSMSTVYVQSGVLDRKEIGKENKAKLTIELVNPTQSHYNDLTVGMVTKDSKITLYENFQPVKLSAIDKGASVKAVFSVYADATTTTGNYPVTFEISYTGLDGTVYTSQETIYVLVTRTADIDDSKNTTKPRIIIQSYKTSVEVIEAGKTFDLDFTLQNTSADTAVTNVKVVLGSEEASTNTGTGTKSNNNVFFPSEGSNSFFMESIAPKASVTRSISLTTSQDVEPGVYSLTLDIQYDADGSAATPATEKLSFPITQQQRLDIQGFSVEDSGMAMTGSPVPVIFQYINKGKATIYNFSVDVEGDFTLQDTTNAYIGNLTSGYNDTYENALLPAKEGECKGAILLKYEDSQGAEKVERKEFTLNVQSGDMGMMGDMDMGGMMPIEPEDVPQTGIPPIILWIAGGVVIVGGGLTTFLILRRRKKKAWEAASDDEEN